MCIIHESGAIELYFYGELNAASRAEVEQHLRGCHHCAGALAELKIISNALASRPDVSAPATGDWSGFMSRLDAAVASENTATDNTGNTLVHLPRRAAFSKPLVTWLAAAALVAITTMSVFFGTRDTRETITPVEVAPAAIVSTDTVVPSRAGVASVGARHIERSKLVVLGLANREKASPSDWAYERELATSLLNDTRLYRMAAEERGLASLAGVMKDLELVLLQTSMARDTDATALPQIQRLIQKRDLVQKMDVVATSGMVP